MNIPNLLQVKAWLDAGAPERIFNMSYFFDNPNQSKNWCGTSCCIAGYIYSTLIPFEEKADPGDFNSYEQVAAEYLNLPLPVAHALFFPTLPDDSSYYEDITTAQASKAIQNVIDHGEPLWETILE